MRWEVLLDEWGHSDKNTVTLLAVEIRCMKWGGGILLDQREVDGAQWPC